MNKEDMLYFYLMFLRLTLKNKHKELKYIDKIYSIENKNNFILPKFTNFTKEYGKADWITWLT
jgi:hypothetical protein